MERNRILIADDESSMRKLYRTFLESDLPKIYSIEEFPNGDTILSELEKDVSRVAVILLDNTMPPGPEGSEIIHRLANTPNFKEKIPFILAYGGSPEIGINAEKNGAYRVLHKPFSANDLISYVESAIRDYPIQSSR